MVRTELVGREQEFAVLSECLEAALAGEPRVVMCQGEPGIGKTRLAEELVAWARVKDVSTVWGRAVETDGAPPFWPWRQVMRATAGVVDVVALADECGLTDDLGGLAPDVFLSRQRVVDAGSPEDRFRQRLTPTNRRRRSLAGSERSPSW